MPSASRAKSCKILRKAFDSAGDQVRAAAASRRTDAFCLPSASLFAGSWPRPMTLPRKLWLLLTLFIVYGGTIPFRFTANQVLVREKLSRVTLDVRISPDTGRRISRSDFVQNVLLFVPFGVLGVLADRRTAGSRGARMAVVTGFALILAATIECLQLFTVDRTASLNDVLANTAGALLGAVAVTAWRPTSTRTRNGLTDRIDSAASYTCELAAILVLIAWWQPFDASIDVRVIAYKIRLLQRDAWQSTGLRD